jgi:hypothetical protein
VCDVDWTPTQQHIFFFLISCAYFSCLAWSFGPSGSTCTNHIIHYHDSLACATRRQGRYLPNYSKHIDHMPSVFWSFQSNGNTFLLQFLFEHLQ